MNDWQTQVDKLLVDYEGITHVRYAAGLAAFRAWYVHSFSAEPDAALLTDDEVRDYRAYLTGVRSYKAATVNAYLASIRAIVRAQGRMLKVKGVKQVSGPVETVDTRDLGRLINAVDGPHWNDKRDVALVNVIARGPAVERGAGAQDRRCRTGATFGSITRERRQGAEGENPGAF